MSTSTIRSAIKDQQALNIAVIRCWEAGDAASLCQMLATTPQQKEAATDAMNKAVEAMGACRKAGGESPIYYVSGRKPDPVMIDILDTPDTRELLAMLKQALTVAERVDASRGHVVSADVPLEDGESRGTDLAEKVSGLVLRLIREIDGAKDKDHEQSDR